MANIPKLQKATLGGGCFWCTEAIFQRVKGIERVVPGYAGGVTPEPTYEAVSGGNTGHAEVIQITFDPAVINYKELLEIFWAVHDPTTPNQQGADMGTQYRSIILYHNDEQRRIAEESKEEANQKWWDGEIVTEIKPLDKFYRAEDYHHNYFNKNPEAAYCQLVINPKLAKFTATFKDKLK